MSDRDPRSISLSLVSHTNAGKTTLARTLLGATSARSATRRTSPSSPTSTRCVETADGERLLLWDTPGFGDSVRLVKRLRQVGAAARLVPEPGLGSLARPPVLGQRSRRCATSATRPT